MDHRIRTVYLKLVMLLAFVTISQSIRTGKNKIRSPFPLHQTHWVIEYIISNTKYNFFAKWVRIAAIQKVANICGCIPEYIPNVREMIENPTIKGCNFYEHATCVSPLVSEFDPSNTNCLPACLDSVYQQVISPSYIVLFLFSLGKNPVYK